MDEPNPWPCLIIRLMRNCAVWQGAATDLQTDSAKLLTTALTRWAVVTALRPDYDVVNSNVTKHVCASNSNEHNLHKSNQRNNQVKFSTHSIVIATLAPLYTVSQTRSSAVADRPLDAS